MNDIKTLAQEFVQAMQPRIGTALMRPIRARIGRPTDDTVWVTDGNLPAYKEVYVHIVSEGDPLSYSTALLGGIRRQDVYLNRPVKITKTESGFYTIVGFDDVEDAIYSEGIEELDNQAPVYLRQLVEIGTLHPVAGSLQFQVASGLFGADYVTGLTSADFSTGTVQDTSAANITLPTTNGLAKGILVQLDPTTPALEYKQSSTFDSILALPQAYNAGLLPAPDANRYHLGYIKLVYGITALTYDHIWQTPELLSKGSAEWEVTLTANKTLAANKQIVLDTITIPTGITLTVASTAILKVI